MKNRVIILNKKIQLKFHTDSVNKLTDMYLPYFKKEIITVNYTFFDRLKLIISKSIPLDGEFRMFSIFKHFRGIKEYIVISEAEVPLSFIFIFKAKVKIILHGAEYYSHKNLRSDSRKKFNERLSRLIIHLIKKRQNVHFLTVSEWSKREWSKGFVIPENKIRVVYNAINEIYFNKQKDFQKKDFCLYVGNSKPQKNLHRLIEAHNQISHELENVPKLTLVGPDNLSEFESEYVTYKGRLSDNELYQTYCHAKYFLFPSIVESFGLPILEAQLCKCKILTSNVTAIPEFSFNKDIEFVDPTSVSSIYDGLKKIFAKNYTFNEENINRISKFTPSNVAKNILE